MFQGFRLVPHEIMPDWCRIGVAMWGAGLVPFSVDGLVPYFNVLGVIKKNGCRVDS